MTISHLIRTIRDQVIARQHCGLVLQLPHLLEIVIVIVVLHNAIQFEAIAHMTQLHFATGNVRVQCCRYDLDTLVRKHLLREMR